MAGRGEEDQRLKQAALHAIRRRYPQAVTVVFETSALHAYGFELMALSDQDGAAIDVDAALWNEVLDLVGDVDWDGVMAESKEGYAVIDLKGQ